MPSPARFGIAVSLVVLAGALEVIFVRAGLVSFRTRGIARLQVSMALTISLLAAASAFALPLFDGDARALHEVSRRRLGTPVAAAIPAVGLGALALFAFQAVEASLPNRHGKLAALAGFVVGLALFGLGLRALVPLVSGAPILPI